MIRFGVALGAEPQTFTGLAGMGDLVTTCVSRHGRNRQVGERLAHGEKLADILQTMAMVAEGVYTTHSVHDGALQMGSTCRSRRKCTASSTRIKTRAAVNDLMLRRPKGEGKSRTRLCPVKRIG